MTEKAKRSLRNLDNVSALVAARPWWQRNLLEEMNKSTCDTPRPVPVKPSGETDDKT